MISAKRSILRLGISPYTGSRLMTSHGRASATITITAPGVSRQKEDRKMTYNDYKAKYGEITSDGKTYALREDAYPTSGSFMLYDGARFDGSWCEASAIDGIS